ncbi:MULTISPECIES: MucR family transcriptional regulator [Methylobacterium]|jgi:predicted transcriptional regulator|uniref:Transcriptional regulatory protein ros n=1 Tax=Methylobacterium isbiliense TaxID=315478 RepID=A0ABQ4SLL8_9HYPH|nr:MULTISPECIES: MucR family transcriptional regulator [Methylobacterium]MBY0299169.1 MucR family transcriptional regulator [Methylobacterium sp.]MDN3624768.1 MucR family transcriptional regulator [Methylobacterium isbiliense]GJE02660.1 Transcriptional regulatory protein ros [Methylobacterium isbiliense]
MSSEIQNDTSQSIELVSDIVSAYVSNNSVPIGELAGLIRSVHEAVSHLGSAAAPQPEKLVPPVPIRKTVTPDFLISLEDGRRYRTLKRHLAGRGLTPEQYRAKWGLPPDYPMVAANYAAQRSELAKSIGLGQKPVDRSRRSSQAA